LKGPFPRPGPTSQGCCGQPRSRRPNRHRRRRRPRVCRACPAVWGWKSPVQP